MKLRVDRITHKGGATATLLRTSWMEGQRVRHRTVADLALTEPEVVVGGLEILLNCGVAFDPAKGAKGTSIPGALHARPSLRQCQSRRNHRGLLIGRVLSSRRTGPTVFRTDSRSDHEDAPAATDAANAARGGRRLPTLAGRCGCGLFGPQLIRGRRLQPGFRGCVSVRTHVECTIYSIWT